MNKDARTKAISNRTRTNAKPARGRKVLSAAAQAAALRVRRTWIVLSGLAGGLAITGLLLHTLAPQPLAPDSLANLSAVGPERSIGQIFDTPVIVRPGRWHSIYVHHSLTAGGDVMTLGQDPGGFADHFLIGNGQLLGEGVIQAGPRWSGQTSAQSAAGIQISADCISICMVGNFDQTRPSPTQQARLLELVSTLQRQLTIDSRDVILGVQAPNSPVAGIGRRFPAAAFQAQLAP